MIRPRKGLAAALVVTTAATLAVGAPARGEPERTGTSPNLRSDLRAEYPLREEKRCCSAPPTPSAATVEAPLRGPDGGGGGGIAAWPLLLIALSGCIALAVLLRSRRGAFARFDPSPSATMRRRDRSGHAEVVARPNEPSGIMERIDPLKEEPETASRPSAEEMRGWAGFRLDEIAGAGVGKVEGVFVDGESGDPVWLLARMGRFGHHTLVPGRDAVAGVGRVWVPYGGDQIRRAPKVNPSEPLTTEAERRLLDHYRIASEAGRASEITDRDPGAVTARPA